MKKIIDWHGNRSTTAISYLEEIINFTIDGHLEFIEMECDERPSRSTKKLFFKSRRETAHDIEVTIVQRPGSIENHQAKIQRKLEQRRQQKQALEEQEKRIAECLSLGICPQCGENVKKINSSLNAILFREVNRCCCCDFKHIEYLPD